MYWGISIGIGAAKGLHRVRLFVNVVKIFQRTLNADFTFLIVEYHNQMMCDPEDSFKQDRGHKSFKVCSWKIYIQLNQPNLYTRMAPNDFG